MKKIFLLNALVVCACNVFAQVSLIPKAGITFANPALSKENVLANGRSSLASLTGGLGVSFRLTRDNFLSIQPEILYSRKGLVNKQLLSSDIHYQLNYVELPLLLKVNFGGEKVKLYVNAGPSIGYLLNGRLKGRTGNTSILNPASEYNVPIEFVDRPVGPSLNLLYANRIEAGLNFGGGVGYAFAGNTVVFLDVRYNLGLTDFSRQEQSKNRVFALTTGVQIPLGK